MKLIKKGGKLSFLLCHWDTLFWHNNTRQCNLRLDKFLKISRVIKRRTVANEAADNGRVSVNGKVVKPSYEVKVGDIVEIQFGDKISKFEIIEIPKVQGKDMGELIKLL